MRSHVSTGEGTALRAYPQGEASGDGGSESLKGWGIGASYDKSGWFARVDYSRRIGTPEIMSDDAQNRERFWFLVGKAF